MLWIVCIEFEFEWCSRHREIDINKNNNPTDIFNELHTRNFELSPEQVMYFRISCHLN